eukprot:12906218-Prorocentrum_lima.AAC.1
MRHQTPPRVVVVASLDHVPRAYGAQNGDNTVAATIFEVRLEGGDRCADEGLDCKASDQLGTMASVH